MATSHVVIVGADKGGVGKTTVSRTILDYFKDKGRSIRAFDSEMPNGVLKRFHPVETELVDITSSDGQMMVFDMLSKQPVTLIDIRAGVLSSTLKTLADIGLMESVRKGTTRLTVLHVLGSSIASFREIAATQAAVEGAKHYLVMNHINDASFFQWSEEARKALATGDGQLVIPKLDELAAEHVEQLGVSFSEFCQDEVQSMVLRGKTRYWLKGLFEQYDGLGL